MLECGNRYLLWIHSSSLSFLALWETVWSFLHHYNNNNNQRCVMKCQVFTPFILMQTFFWTKEVSYIMLNRAYKMAVLFKYLTVNGKSSEIIKYFAYLAVLRKLLKSYYIIYVYNRWFKKCSVPQIYRTVNTATKSNIQLCASKH